MGTEEVTLDFAEDAIDALADLSAEINSSVENIGARRLHTVLEKLLEEISFTATDRGGETIRIDAEMVRKRVGELATNADQIGRASCRERVCRTCRYRWSPDH